MREIDNKLNSVNFKGIQKPSVEEAPSNIAILGRYIVTPRIFDILDETKPGKGNAGYAVKFIVGILKAFNGTEAQGIGSDEIGLNALRHYNMA